MGKMIFWLVVFFVVLFALRLVNVSKSRSRHGRSASGPKAIDGSMSRCVNCGVYLPSADAIAGPRGPLCGDPQCATRRSDDG
jgi:hypothetical protein